MISKGEIQDLAQLSRLQLTQEEIDLLQKDFESILSYVGQVRAAAGRQESLLPRNTVMRADEPRGAHDPLEGKEEAILAQAPERQGSYFMVRRILRRDE